MYRIGGNLFGVMIKRRGKHLGTGGVFDVRLDEEIIFSKKSAGRFPESKELMQLVRDRIAPDKDLGHSDKD